MTRRLSTLTALFLCGLASMAIAQTETEVLPETEAAAETATPSATEATTDAAAESQPEAATEASAEDAKPADGLDMGAVEGEEPAESPMYVKSTHGDWQVRCFRNEQEGAEDLCQMFQLLTEDAGNPVAEFSVFRLPKGARAAAGATIVVPLGTLLNEDLKLSVDRGAAKVYSYSFCTIGGCFARIGLTDSDIASFKAGNRARMQIVPAQAPDKPVDITISLTGFTAAYREVSEIPQ